MVDEGGGSISLELSAGDELATAEVADRIDGDVTVQEAHERLDVHPDVVKVRDGQAVRWRLVDEGLSDMPCPLGCGFRPSTGRGAFVHLLAHAVGRHSTAEEQGEMVVE